MKFMNRIMAIVAIVVAICIFTASVPSVSEGDPQPVLSSESPIVLSEDEYDVGIDPFTIFIIGVAIGIVAKIVWDNLHGNLDTSNNDALAREAEASKINDLINTNLTTGMNFTDVINQLVPLTQDHFVRQAELSAAYSWSPDKDFDSSSILEMSSARNNLSDLTQNVFAAYSEILTMISDRMNLWKTDDRFSGKMTLTYMYGSNRGISSQSSIAGEYLPVVKSSAGSNRVYISGPFVYVSEDAYITSSVGHVIQLYKGYNDLGSDFIADIYTLQNDRVYAGYMIPSLTVNGAIIHAGIVMKAGSETKVAYLDTNGKDIIIDNRAYNSVSLLLETSDGDSKTMDVSKVLTVIKSLQSEISKIQTAAATAASALWNIYDKAGESNVYITTLSVPEHYNNVKLSKVQTEIITILALEQMADFSNANMGDIKTGNYKISPESLSLYCYGSILDSKGNVLIEDAIFTPFFYNNDLTLFTGSNKIAQYGTVAVWKQGAGGFSDTDMNFNQAGLLSTYSGCTFNISSMMYDGHTVSSVNLDVANIDITMLREYDIDPPINNDHHGKDWKLVLQVTVILLGAAMLIYGIITKNKNWIIGGIILILAGLLVVPLIFKAAGIISSWRLP